MKIPNTCDVCQLKSLCHRFDASHGDMACRNFHDSQHVKCKMPSPSGRWKEKLRAFCEGLEVENIDMLFDRSEVHDYHLLGQVMAKRIRDKIYYK